MRFYSLNRTLCDVLTEMRKAVKTLNFSYILSLIEEIQVLGNRMEAALYDVKDIKRLREDIKELKDELEELQKQKKELNGKEPKVKLTDFKDDF